MSQIEAIVNRPKMKELIEMYVRGDISMEGVANELSITKSAVSYIFNKKIKPSPVELRASYYKSACKFAEDALNSKTPIETIIERYPFFASKEKLKRLIRKGDICTSERVLTKNEWDNLKLKKEIIELFNQDLSVNEIAFLKKVKRGKVLSALRTEFGSTSISRAKEQLYETRK